MIQKVLDPKFQVKTFSIKYDRKISKHAKIILQSFKLKVYYYVIDDILYFLKSDQNECDYLVQILHSTAIFLQNNFGVNFFDIYIYDIRVNETPKFNRFTNNEKESLKFSNNIIIKLAYQVQPLEKNLETTW
tara:strand:- start:966 stop:1361 length:396 start_codon:yes stop_codon:yes gene_type:complete